MPKKRVIDVVPAPPNKDGNRGDSGVDANYIGQKDGKISSNDRTGQTETNIADAVENFLPLAELIEAYGRFPSC